MHKLAIHAIPIRTELLSIVCALGQWRHYFQSHYSVIVRILHSPLSYMSNQASVNSRVWKSLVIMQGYDLKMPHILGKVNPANYFSTQPLTGVIR